MQCTMLLNQSTPEQKQFSAFLGKHYVMYEVICDIIYGVICDIICIVIYILNML